MLVHVTELFLTCKFNEIHKATLQSLVNWVKGNTKFYFVSFSFLKIRRKCNLSIISEEKSEDNRKS